MGVLSFLCTAVGVSLYILLRSKAMQYRFMSDADREGVTFGDGKKATDRMAEDIMALKADGTICFLGWAGHMCYHQSPNAAIRIDYEKYIDGADDYIIVPGKGE